MNWNLIFNGLTALGTVSAVLVALYLELIKNWLKRPILNVTFKNKPRWKVETVVLNNVPLPAIWFRIKVENKGKTLAEGVKGKLIEIYHPDGKTRREDIDPMELHWTGIKSPTIDLIPEEFEYLDIFHVYKEIDQSRYKNVLSEKGLQESDDFWQLDRLHLYTTDRTPRNVTFDPERDDYFLRITIHSANADSVQKTYRIRNSKKDLIKMEEVKY